MTKIVLEEIKNIDDLLLFSKSFKEGLIKLNISKLAKELNKDRRTIKKYLNGDIPWIGYNKLDRIRIDMLKSN